MDGQFEIINTDGVKVSVLEHISHVWQKYMRNLPVVRESFGDAEAVGESVLCVEKVGESGKESGAGNNEERI